MIGQLKGTIDSYGDDYVILDVHGVGYIVSCSARTLQNLPRPGEAAVLAIETYVREDQIRLFGFASADEKEWFRLLISRANGVGKRLAERVVQELKDKGPAFASIDPGVVSLVGQVSDKTAPKPVADAVSALVNLGYPQIRASAAVATAARDAGEAATTEKLIRLALKELAS